MTEAEWLACDDPKSLLEFLLRRLDRKFRLAAVGACRVFSDFLADDRISAYIIDQHTRDALAALSVAERFADGQATDLEREAAGETMRTLARSLSDADPLIGGDNYDEGMRLRDAETVVSAIRDALSLTPEGTFSSLWAIPGTEFLLARTLREVFGPPTSPTFNRGWLTATVTTLARQMYESGDFSAMPILADALQDAGCDSADILDHCRGRPKGVQGELVGEPHVRGCWVVDLVLEKE
jgi:hypothetical protein